MNFFIKFVIIIIFSIFQISFAVQAPRNFQEAKKVARILFAANPVTLYCRCKYDASFKVDLDSCGMLSATHIKRARVVEWEHMMPAENIGQQLQCWREKICVSKGKSYKGRKCCEKIDTRFQKAEAELYNLWPAVGLVNQVRSNYRYSPLPNEDDFFGCNFKVDKTLRKVEPADDAKGIVARANLFMSRQYDIQLSDAQRKLFETWNKEFPPSLWEKQWASEVAQIEGYPNPFIH